MNKFKVDAIALNLEDLPAAEHAALLRFLRGLPRNGSRVLVTARTRLNGFEDLPAVRTLDLTQGLDDWNGAYYVHHLAQQKAIADLQEPPRVVAGQVEGRCAWVARQLSGHPKMIEVAVGVARKGFPALERALQQLSGSLEQQLEGLLATGLRFGG